MCSNQSENDNSDWLLQYAGYSATSITIYVHVQNTKADLVKVFCNNKNQNGVLLLLLF